MRYVSSIMEDTGHRTIRAARTSDGSLTSDPDALFHTVLNSFQAQHGEELPTLEPHTRRTIHNNVTKVVQRQQRRTSKYTPSNIPVL